MSPEPTATSESRESAVSSQLAAAMRMVQPDPKLTRTFALSGLPPFSLEIVNLPEQNVLGASRVAAVTVAVELSRRGLCAVADGAEQIDAAVAAPSGRG